MQNKKGFTLIEVMLAALLGTIVLSALAVPMVSMLRLNIRSQTTATLQGSIQAASYRLHDQIRNGYDGYSYATVTNGILTIEQPDQTVSFYTNSESILIFDPDTETDDDEIEILENVTDFSASKEVYPTYHIYITLAAEDSSSSHEISTEIAAAGRNQE